MSKRVFPTSGHTVIIKEIANLVKERVKAPEESSIDESSEALTNKNLDIKYTVRKSFPGSNGKGKHKGITNGGQTHTSVATCISNHFNGNTTKISNFNRYYYKPSSGTCANGYVTNGSGVFPVNAPTSRRDYVGNCTAYAYGRSLELIEDAINKEISDVVGFMPTGGDFPAGGSFFWNAAGTVKNGKNRGRLPYYWKLIGVGNAKPAHLLPGTIICYSTINHVAVVEKVDGNKVYISHSVYSASGCKEIGGNGFLFDYFSTEWKGGNSKLGAGVLNSSGYNVAGFIVPDWPKIKAAVANKTL